MASDFAKEVRELMTQAQEADRENREEAIADLKFEAGFQWNETVRRERESRGLPCLTVNTAQQYTGQVVGDWRSNETAIKALPREDGDQTVADVRSELIRSIELQSKADRIYASSIGQAAACGISNFRVTVEDALDNPFVKDIFIRDIPDPLAVWWDPLAHDPTGRDAAWCFVGDELSKDEYQRLYKDAALPTLINRECGSEWSDGKTVHVPEYWRMEERPRTFGMTVTGKVVDLTDTPKRKWPQLAIDSDTKQPIVRDKVKCKYAVMVLTNGMEPLTDPYEARLPRLPIIRVTGREGLNEGKRIRFGLIRFMRDSIMMRNHNRSIRAELLMKFPRVNFIGPASAIDGLEGDWSSYLGFNDGAQMPIEVTGRNLGALIAEDQIYTQDLRDVTGIHEASLGMPSNETSGVAIRARQSEGDVATVIYHDNALAAQQEAGEVINAYIPTVYDTARTLRTVGADLAVKMVKVNDPDDPDAIDLGVGSYDITISTGPAYATRRQEARDSLAQLFTVYPPAAQVMGDLYVASLDVPNADKMAERARRAMDPRILGDDAQDDKSPEQQQADAQQAQQAQAMQQTALMLEAQGKQAEIRLKVAQADEAEAKAAKAKFDTMQATGMIAGQPDPSVQAEAERTAIMGYDAETRRLAALMKGDMPGTPPLLSQHLAPIIANAVGQALAKHLGFAPVELGLPSATSPAAFQPSNDTPSQDMTA